MNHDQQLPSTLPRRTFLAAGGVASWLFLNSQFSTARNIADSDAKQIVHTDIPRNSEPALDKLVASWITPNEHFYVRSHAAVPQVDLKAFRLSVEGLVHKPLQISVEQLEQRYKKHSVVATLTCAGNRRSEHSLVKLVDGVPWQAGAIGNASWGGTALFDLLKQAAVKENASHVWFEGVDEIERPNGTIPFGASIPLSKAMSKTGSVPGAVVTYEMNGQRLPPHHGFPLRTVVPGYIGARSVKWLGKIIVSDRPSTNHYVASAYKLVTAGTDDQWSAAPPIGLFPINAVACSPAPGSRIPPGKIDVRGYAVAAGEPHLTLAKVELSTDAGKTWSKARFTSPAKPFCWRLWSANVQLTPHATEILVKATDSAGNVQPRSVAWNLKGYLFNAWHRTPLQVGEP